MSVSFVEYFPAAGIIAVGGGGGPLASVGPTVIEQHHAVAGAQNNEK